MSRGEQNRRRAEQHRSASRRRGRAAKELGLNLGFDPGSDWSRDHEPIDRDSRSISDMRQRALQLDSPSRENGSPVTGEDAHLYWWTSQNYGLVVVLDVHALSEGGRGLGTHEASDRLRRLERVASLNPRCKHIAIVHGHHERHKQLTWREVVLRKYPHGRQLNPGVTIVRVS